MNDDIDHKDGMPSFLLRLLETPWMGSMVVDGLSRIIHINRTMSDFLGMGAEEAIGHHVTAILGCDEEDWKLAIEEGAGHLSLGAKGGVDVETRSYPCGGDSGRRCIVFDIGARIGNGVVDGKALWESLGIGGLRWKVGTDDVVVENLRIEHPSHGIIRIDLDTEHKTLSLKDKEGERPVVRNEALDEFKALFSNLNGESILEAMERHRVGGLTEVSEFFSGYVGGQLTWLEVSLSMEDDGVWAKGLVRQVPKGLRDGIKAIRTVSDFNNILERIPSALCIIQGDEVVFMNGRMATFLQMKAQDVVGRSFFELIHPDDRSRVIERYRSRMAGGNPPSEYSIRIIGGTGMKHARINSNIIEWEGDRAALVTLDDVSSYVSMEEKLKEEERLKRSILNSFPNPVILSSPSGKLVWSNLAARKKLSIDENDVECHQLVAPGEQFDSKTFWKGVEKEGDRVLEDILLRDGRHYRVTGQAVFEKGEFSGIVHDMRDITEQLENARAAAMARERLDTASRALGFSSVVYEFGKDHLTIDGVPEEVISLDEQGRLSISALSKVIHPEDLPSLVEILDAGTIVTGEMASRTFRANFRGGPFRWYRLLVTKLDHGEGAYLSGAVFDVHELHTNQLSLEVANRKLNLLTGITDHDIRNQLTALSGYTEIILERGKKERDPKEQQLLEKMMDSISIIGEQLEFARDYRELGLEEPRWVDVGRKVEQLQEHPSFSHLEIINEAAGIMLFADPLFKKVLYNIFENSVRHGGHVTMIRVHSPEPGKVVVEDDGVGIETSFKERLFNRDVGKNTGLGMFLTKEILGITGITIMEDGVPGEGARFVIMAPRDSFQDLKVRNGLAL